MYICFLSTECGAADVALVLDNSGSVGSSNFNLMKQFLKNVIDMPEFVIGQTPPRILMGAVKFATSPSFQFNLQQYTNEPALKNAVSAVGLCVWAKIMFRRPLSSLILKTQLFFFLYG